MNKRTLIAMLIALLVAGFSALQGDGDRALTNDSTPAAESIEQLTQQQRVVSYVQ